MTEKEKKISKEKKKLLKVFNSYMDDKKEVITRLISRAAFLLIMSEDMETELKECDKYTTTIVNASQSFVKANPLLKDYRDTVKSYQAVLKQLIDLSSENNAAPKDELEEFLNK